MGVGDAWGTREEMLHPRDSKGRFRSSWKMAEGVVDKIVDILSKFNPRTFTSQDEANNYVHGLATRNRQTYKPAIEKFLRGYGKVNADLRAGKANPDAQEMQRLMQPLPDDLIVTRTGPPSIVGLDPNNVANAEELTGKLVQDKGFWAANIGGPLPHQDGNITFTMAVPKGTKALAPSTSKPNGELIFEPDQPFRITEVNPDGKGGFFVYAVAAGDSEAPQAVDIRTAVPGNDVQEQGGEGVEVPGGVQEGAGGDLGIPPKRTAGRPKGPGPGPRNDGHVGVVGQGQTGDTTGEVPGETGDTTEVVDIPKVPETGKDPRGTFREAFKEAGLSYPTEGPRRKAFNEAFLGLTSGDGKKTVQQISSKLDDDIAYFRGQVDSDARDGTDSGPLPEDVKRLEALSDLIKEHFNFTGRKNFKAAETKTPAKKTAAKKAVAEVKGTEGSGVSRFRGNEKQQKLNEIKERRAAKSEEGIKPYTEADREKKVEAFRKAATAVHEGKSAAEIEAIAYENAETIHPEDVGWMSEILTMADDVRKGNTAEAKRRSVASLRSQSKKDGEERFIEDLGRNNRRTRLAAKKAAKAARSTGSIAGDLKRLDKEEGARKAAAKKVPAKKAVAKAAGDDIDGMTVAQLRDEAKKRGIKIPSTARRKDDIKALLRGENKETEAKVPAKKTTKAAIKKVIPKKSVETTETKTEEEAPKKPTWGTLKTQGFKNGDIVMWHGQDRRAPKAEGRRVRIEFDPSGYALVDPDTGKTVHAGGFAHRSWFTPDTGAPKKAVAKKVAGQTTEKGPRAGSKKLTPERREEIAAELDALREELSTNNVANKKDLGLPPLTDVIEGWAKGVRDGDMDDDDLDQLIGRIAGIRYGVSDDSETKAISKALFASLDRIRGEGTPRTKKPAEKGLLFMTVAELKKKAADENIKIPTSLRLKKDIVDWLADALVAKERGEEGPEVPKKPKTEFQKKVEENHRIREEEAKERRIAKESRMRLAGQIKEQRAREAQARQEQREAAKTEREAQREQERLRKAQERVEAREQKRREREEQKVADAKRREEEKRAQELEGTDNYDTLSGPGWTVTMLRQYAEQEGIKIPNSLRFRSEIREHILVMRKNQRTQRIAAAKSRRELFDIGKAEGITFPPGTAGWTSEDIARWIDESRQLLADMGIDREKYKPQVVLQQPPGINATGRFTKEQWDQMAPHDTDPNHPMQIRNFNMGDGYTIHYGVLVRRNGIAYLVETDTATEAKNPYLTARVVKDIEDIHQGLPSGDKYQWDYRWLRRRNPYDSHWAQEYKTPGFRSLATAGGGRVQFWDRDASMVPSHHTASFRHEYGHNVDGYGGGQYFRHGISSSTRWSDAARNDSNHVQRLRFIPAPAGISHPLQFEVLPDKGWPWGVTTYGKSSHGEDFAESVSLYMSQRILGFDTSSGTSREMRFRDLYPERARILDEIFPEVAKKQKDGSYYNN